MRPKTYYKYTQEDLDYIREHCDDKTRDVVEVVGGNYRTVQAYMEQFRNGTFNRSKSPPRYYYALYLRKTDELVCSGSADECAEQLGITRNSFYHRAYRALTGRSKKWDVYVEPYSEAI